MQREYFWLQKIIKIALVVMIGVWGMSFFYTPSVPRSSNLVPEVAFEPVQTKTTREPFTFEKQGRAYFVNPLFDYELWGVVVSKNALNSFIDPHNIKHEVREYDFCVIWGRNAQNNVMDFVGVYSENYTCYFYPKDTSVDWKKDFQTNQLSNNHLLSSDSRVSQKIHDVEIGDQIYLRGSLVSYGSQEPNYVIRTSSTTRNDMGNGACETIYVDELTILRKSQPFLSWLMKYSLWIVLLLVGGQYFITWSIRCQKKKHLQALRAARQKSHQN